MEKFRDLMVKFYRTSSSQNQPLSEAQNSIFEKKLDQILPLLNQTPDHPPYAWMIQKAIEELAEKRGSSEKLISDHIKKKFKELPWAHDTLLNHHLKNLCMSGDIVLIKNHKYVLPGFFSDNKPTKKITKKKRVGKDEDCDFLSEKMKKNKLQKAAKKQYKVKKEDKDRVNARKRPSCDPEGQHVLNEVPQGHVFNEVPKGDVVLNEVPGRQDVLNEDRAMENVEICSSDTDSDVPIPKRQERNAEAMQRLSRDPGQEQTIIVEHEMQDASLIQEVKKLDTDQNLSDSPLGFGHHMVPESAELLEKPQDFAVVAPGLSCDAELKDVQLEVSDDDTKKITKKKHVGKEEDWDFSEKTKKNKPQKAAKKRYKVKKEDKDRVIARKRPSCDPEGQHVLNEVPEGQDVLNEVPKEHVFNEVPKGHVVLNEDRDMEIVEIGSSDTESDVPIPKRLERNAEARLIAMQRLSRDPGQEQSIIVVHEMQDKSLIQEGKKLDADQNLSDSPPGIDHHMVPESTEFLEKPQDFAVVAPELSCDAELKHVQLEVSDEDPTNQRGERMLVASVGTTETLEEFMQALEPITDITKFGMQQMECGKHIDLPTQTKPTEVLYQQTIPDLKPTTDEKKTCVSQSNPVCSSGTDQVRRIVCKYEFRIPGNVAKENPTKQAFDKCGPVIEHGQKQLDARDSEPIDANELQLLPGSGKGLPQRKLRSGKLLSEKGTERRMQGKLLRSCNNKSAKNLKPHAVVGDMHDADNDSNELRVVLLDDDDEEEDDDDDDYDDATLLKSEYRGRGRARKVQSEEEQQQIVEMESEKAKQNKRRGKGRPPNPKSKKRKVVIRNNDNPEMRRGRGRPRKSIIE